MKNVLKWLGSYFKHVDKLLPLICVSLTVFDLFVIHALYTTGDIQYDDFQTQLFAAIIGLFVSVFIGMIDYKFISKAWFVIGPAALILQLLVYTPLGVQRDDDLAWLNLGFITIQPSEIFKVAFIITFATHIAKVGDKLNKFTNILLLGLHAAIPFGLILIQGDAGSALVFLFICLCMLFAAGISWKYITAAVAATPVVCWVAWNYVMGPQHKIRFEVLFDEEMQEAERLNVYMQQFNAKVAMGSGQLTGLGFHSDSYTYVPEIYNDFIFSYIGMTMGFIGCMGLVIALAVLCLKLLSNSTSADTLLGKSICVGVFAMMTFNCIINIGMVVSLIPIIGITLPFISAGGTSMVINYAAIGLVLSVSAHKEKKKHMFYEEKD